MNALEAAGGRLVVLTSDSEPVLREAIAEHGFGATFVRAEPELWAAWGLANEKRGEIPYPTTFIIAPDGTLVYREIHVNHMKRAHVPAMIERVAAWSQPGSAVATPAPEPEPEPEPAEPAAPDWANAVQLAAFVEAAELVIQLEVGPGFHVYGANETISRPLAATVDQLPELQIPIPSGHEKVLSDALGAAWVLDGTVQLRAPLPADAPAALTGTLDYQVCTASTCTAPTSAPWQAAVEDDR